MRYLCGLMVAILAVPASAAWEDDWQAASNQLLLDWHQAADALAQDIDQQCSAATDATLNSAQRQALQPAWQSLVEHWGAVVSQAPALIDELGLGYRLAFWPDSRGVVVRQMQTHQSERASGQYLQLQLAGQGIQGVDWMLAQPEPDCVLLQDWSAAYRGYLDQIAAQLPPQPAATDRLLTLAANDLYAQASRLNQRLREVIAQADGRYRPYMGDVSETGQSLRLVRGGLLDLADRLVLISAGFPDRSQDATAAALSRQLIEVAQSLPDGWPADDASVAWALSERVRQANVAVEHWLSDEVAQRYSLLIGFNNQDGD